MVKVRFIKSGVQYGYAYGHGEACTMPRESAVRLHALGVVEIIDSPTVEMPKYEAPEQHTGFAKIEKRRK